MGKNYTLEIKKKHKTKKNSGQIHEIIRKQ